MAWGTLTGPAMGYETEGDSLALKLCQRELFPTPVPGPRQQRSETYSGSLSAALLCGLCGGPTVRAFLTGGLCLQRRPSVTSGRSWSTPLGDSSRACKVIQRSGYKDDRLFSVSGGKVLSLVRVGARYAGTIGHRLGFFPLLPV